MGNANAALPVIPDVDPKQLRSGPGIVFSFRVPEDSRETADAFRAFCKANKLATSRVILAAVTEYLKRHGGAR